MTNRDYTVSELAKLAGVSVRTLYHYHAKGLLLPAHRRANGYRSYGLAERLRLQEILFLRAFGLGLGEIATALEAPGDTLTRLTAQRARLVAEQARLGELLQTLEAAIADISSGAFQMTDDLYQPHNAETQDGYEAWLIETYGPQMSEAIATSRSAVAAEPEGMAGLMAELKQVEGALVAAYTAGIAAAQVPEAFEAHRALVARFWGRTCPPEAYAGLAGLYESHPDFIARYERLAPRFSGWLVAGMRIHAEPPGQ